MLPKLSETTTALLTAPVPLLFGSLFEGAADAFAQTPATREARPKPEGEAAPAPAPVWPIDCRLAGATSGSDSCSCCCC